MGCVCPFKGKEELLEGLAAKGFPERKTSFIQSKEPERETFPVAS